MLSLSHERKKNATTLSAKTREKVFDCLYEAGRPMAVSEILRWLRCHEPTLYMEIGVRCQDYMRVILGQTCGIAKYIRKVPLFGIDKRTRFFGIESISYNTEKWEKVPTTILQARNCFSFCSFVQQPQNIPKNTQKDAEQPQQNHFQENNSFLNETAINLASQGTQASYGSFYSTQNNGICQNYGYCNDICQTNLNCSPNVNLDDVNQNVKLSDESYSFKIHNNNTFNCITNGNLPFQLNSSSIANTSNSLNAFQSINNMNSYWNANNNLTNMNVNVNNIKNNTNGIGNGVSNNVNNRNNIAHYNTDFTLNSISNNCYFDKPAADGNSSKNIVSAGNGSNENNIEKRSMWELFLNQHITQQLEMQFEDLSIADIF
ncbi:hypothetical protein TRFO_01555 [Tritrichomonas foetus]|uniref:Uncharacterized protein n=1 Tax=Tritrichomonas foetus TaxID=1144522 RepID=A0A1J4JXX3_9EUKA|nr:hypothetical protein TRFO_01555 [Tritrichomonas foetus]|eukprot:OHT03843.1 hypothetical protein TRFO_01555 [Tritrichomonas foetus]